MRRRMHQRRESFVARVASALAQLLDFERTSNLDEKESDFVCLESSKPLVALQMRPISSIFSIEN